VRVVRSLHGDRELGSCKQSARPSVRSVRSFSDPYQMPLEGWISDETGARLETALYVRQLRSVCLATCRVSVLPGLAQGPINRGEQPFIFTSTFYCEALPHSGDKTDLPLQLGDDFLNRPEPLSYLGSNTFRRERRARPLCGSSTSVSGFRTRLVDLTCRLFCGMFSEGTSFRRSIHIPRWRRRLRILQGIPRLQIPCCAIRAVKEGSSTFPGRRRGRLLVLLQRAAASLRGLPRLPLGGPEMPRSLARKRSALL
jgi:hypothetical protein